MLIVSWLQAVAVALYNPEAFRTFGQLRLDMGSVLPERMSDEAYNELLVRHSSLHTGHALCGSQCTTWHTCYHPHMLQLTHVTIHTCYDPHMLPPTHVTTHTC